MKRGRRSIAELTTPVIDVDRSRVIPVPRGLKRDEADIFRRTAKLHPHLTEADATLLTLFVQATAKAGRLARKDDGTSVKAWDQAVRAAMLAARSLRLTPQSQIHPQTAGRARANAAPIEPPWERPFSRDEIDDDDEGVLQ